MALERASTLYAVRGTTVDTGTGVDIKLLDNTQGGTDEAMSVRWGHTNDNVERTFAPSQGLYTAVLNANTLQKLGFALRLSDDMTPADDTNCNAYLPAGTATVTLNLRLNMNGGTSNLGGTVNFTIRASLWRYNPSTDTGTSIANGSVGLSWNTAALGDNNTYKDAVISVVVPATEFAQGEILLMQMGALSPTLPNPIAGTTNFDMNANTQFCKIDWAAGQSIRAACALSLSALGEGVPSRGAHLATMSRSALGEGATSYTKSANISKTFNAVGEGMVTHKKDLEISRSTVGDGISSMTRTVVAAKTFDAVGEGTAARTLVLALSRTPTGEGVLTYTKAVIAAKTFNLLGEGVPTESRNVQAQRTFSLTGEGSVPASIRAVAIPRSTAGEGVVTYARSVIASKSFSINGEGAATRVVAPDLTRNLTGEGVATESRTVQAFRTFSLVGEGTIPTTGPNASSITLPIDEIPTEGSGGPVIVRVIRPVFDD